MPYPFIGEIRMIAIPFAPAGWMFCAGQSLAIAENDSLFQLIGTTYGGDGVSTFNLPDLRGRLPMHFDSTYSLAQMAGSETVTLSTQQMPRHNHMFVASTNIATQLGPLNNTLAQSTLAKMYYADVADQVLASNSILGNVGSLPHDNLQPFLCVSFIISLYGIYPPPT
jgi:microcystin-dependent protein